MGAALAFLVGKGALNIPATIKNAENRHKINGDADRNHGPAFKANDPKAGPKIVTLHSALGEGRKGVAKTLDALDVANREGGSGARRDEVVKVKQVGKGLRAEFNPVAHAASF